VSWSAQQYTQFEQERTRPVRDLIAAIPTQSVTHAVDLGCGPGNSTEVLLQRYPSAQVTGLDSAADMLKAARQRLPAVNFSLADIASWNPTQHYDVILANASLQWLADHHTLYPHLASKLTAGGSLAIQTPDNLQEPSHVLMHEIAQDPRWRSRICTVQHPARHDAQYYHQLLKPLSQQLNIWRTTYFHALPAGATAIVEMFKSTALRPYLAKLTPDEQQQFLQAYTQAIASAYPADQTGSVLLPFPRLFVLATR